MQLLKIGKGTLQKLVGALLVTTLHSMPTKRAVSHYNIIRSTRRQAMSEETVKGKLSAKIQNLIVNSGRTRHNGGVLKPGHEENEIL